MSYIALYRQWRPLTFDDVVEQQHIVKSLKYSVKNGRIAHAYLFCGTRGTGKTTMAQILSRAVNCLDQDNGNPCNGCEICKGILSGSLLDVMEIDAASNNSVDNIRDIRDEVMYTPSRARHKVYIIDEVHMLSTGAFNALLKTLEEPPSHVIFILATTEPHKLPATILSRCQRYDFRRITSSSIASRLDKVSKANNIDVEEEALNLISRLSDGALRDALSILDQCISLGNKKITFRDVLSVTGVVNEEFVSSFVDLISKKDIKGLLDMIKDLTMEGKDIAQFLSALILYYRNLLLCKLLKNVEGIIEASKEIVNKMRLQSSSLGENNIINIITELSDLESGLKWASHPRIMLEVVLIKICANSTINNAALSDTNVPGIGIPNAASTLKSDKQSDSNIKSNGAKSGDASGDNANIDIKNDDELNQVWKNVLEELLKCGKGPLYFILKPATLTKMDEKHIGVILPGDYGANKDIVSQPDNIRLIEDLLRQKLGLELKVKCFLEKDVEKNKGDEKNPHNEDDELDDCIKKIYDFANAVNAPLNIYDK